MGTLNESPEAGRDQSIVILPFSFNVKGGELRFFVNVQKVAKVVEPQRLSPLPAATKPFTAMLDLDGRPVPVLQLSSWEDGAFAGVEPRKGSASSVTGSRIVVCHVLNHYVGIEVSRTRKIMRQPNAALLPPPDVLQGPAGKLIAGVIRDDGHFLYMFDVEGLLESHGVALGKTDAAPTPTSALASLRVLIVEDSTFFQNLATQLLTKHGAKVDLAKDGQEGLERLRANGNAYDLVFSDIEMPRMSGLEMARRYRAEASAPLPILFHSSISNPALIKDIEAEGLGEYLVKFDESHIVKKLATMLPKHKVA